MMKKLLALSSLLSIQALHAQDEIFFGKFEDFFVGPKGCTPNCQVPENTDFSLFWSASNATSCSITNIGNNLPANDFHTIVGGISQTTSYTIDCPTNKSLDYQLKLKNLETFAINLPENQKIMLRVINGETLMLNLVEDDNLKQFKLNKDLQFTQYDKHLWYAQVNIPKGFNPNNELGKINMKNIKPQSSFDKIWLFISEQDPNVAEVDYAYNEGFCDNLATNPALNISSNALQDADFNTECVLEANKTYYISKAYLMNQ